MQWLTTGRRDEGAKKWNNEEKRDYLIKEKEKKTAGGIIKGYESM